MFDNLSNTQIAESSEEDLLAAAGPVKTEGSDKNKSNEKSSGKTDKTDKSKDEPAPKEKVSASSKKDLDIAFGGDDDDTEDEEEKVVDKKAKGKKAAKADDTEEDTEEDKEEDKEEGEEDEKTEEEEDDDTKKDKDTKKDEVVDDTDDDTKAFLKARVNLLIKKGEWAKFDGWEEVEWDEETFGEIELKQREFQKAELREDLLDSFGPYGRDIAEHSAKGGDPDKLIEIFKEQQRVSSLSIETEESQKAVVLKYATEFQNMKPERAKKYVDGLIADKELADAAKEAKDNMEADLKVQEQDEKDQADEIVNKQAAKQKAELTKFSTDVNNVINSRDDIPADEKRDLLKVLTKFDRKLKNGTPVNDFYFKFAEFRKNLPNYIELVRFVMDPKKYVKTAKNEGKSEASEKDFRLIRTGNKTKKAKDSSDASSSSSGNEKKSTFKLLY